MSPTRWVVPPPLEKVVQAHVTAALRALGCHVSSTTQTRPSRQAIGMPDLWVMAPHWHFACWLEIKRPGGRLSPAQQLWHQTAAAAGVPVFTVDSVAGALAALLALGAPIQTRAGVADGR